MKEIDIPGLLLLATSLTLILFPLTLYRIAENGYKNRNEIFIEKSEIEKAYKQAAKYPYQYFPNTISIDYIV